MQCFPVMAWASGCIDRVSALISLLCHDYSLQVIAFCRAFETLPRLNQLWLFTDKDYGIKSKL